MSRRELCRICTKFTNGPLKNIFKEENLIKQINEISGILLNDSKQLPQYICTPCEDDLEKAYEFRERCISAQEYFSSIDKNKRNEIIDDTTVKSRYPNIQIKDELTIEETHIDDICNVKEKFCEQYQYDCEDHDGSNQYNDDVGDKLADSKSGIDVEMGLDNSKRLAEKLQPRSKRKDSKFNEEYNKKSMKQHSERLKPYDRNQIFICEQCGNNFNCKHNFAKHLHRHTGDKRMQCELCPDKFYTNSELNSHMRKHTGERPFECKHCGRRFSDLSSKIKHERTHTNERPFVCSYCAKAFTTSYILKNHMLVHTGERSFKCDLCNKFFQRQTHLVVHFKSIMHQQNERKQKENNSKQTKNEV